MNSQPPDCGAHLHATVRLVARKPHWRLCTQTATVVALITVGCRSRRKADFSALADAGARLIDTTAVQTNGGPNQRSSGIPYMDERDIKHLTADGVVANPSRTAALIGALRAGTATDLVLDEGTARAVLDRLRI